jgi:hypothetical protein
MGSKGKPKFCVGQVVRVAKTYFRIGRHHYSADRCASWDNGWWYKDGYGSIYSEYAVRPLTSREAGRGRKTK